MENRQKHILFLCSWYPHPGDQSNGIFIRRHAQALSLKHRVTVVYARSAEAIHETLRLHNEEENFEELLFFYPKLGGSLPGIAAARRFGKLKQAYRQLIDSLAGRRFDIIHVNTIFPAAIPALYALKRFPEAKLFITEHWSGYYPEDGNYKGTLVPWYTKRLVARARALFVISGKLESAMKAHGLNSHYHLIHNTVDTKLFRPHAHQSPAVGPLRILHVSTLTEREKNISGILAVAAVLKRRGVSFHLSLVGHHATEMPAHQKLAQAHHLEGFVTFTGTKSPEAVAEAMNQADVFLLFSHFEGAPVVVTEALACGLPVISTPVGRIADMIPQGMGRLLGSNSPEDCANVLQAYRRSDYTDPKTMHRYISDIYSPEAVCSEISGLYETYS